MNDERGPWYLITGLVIGILIGVLYSWGLSPVSYVDTDPASLRSDFQDRYRVLIAVAYVANGDLARAETRLALLGEPEEDFADILSAQAQRNVAENGPPDEARALGVLADALRGSDIAGARPTITPVGGVGFQYTATVFTSTPTITLTPTISLTPTLTSRATRTHTATPTPLSTRTATPTQGAPYVMQSLELVCNPNLAQGLLLIFTRDVAGSPVPGVEIVITWPGGENHFFTGQKPEVDLGYADFVMTPGVLYELSLTDGGEPVSGLTPVECEGEGDDRYWGGWQVVWAQP